MTTEKKELHIFPCTDTLLYFPVYLAIDVWRVNEAPGVAGSRKPSGAIVWDLPKVAITLHPPANGDRQAIQRLCEHEEAWKKQENRKEFGIAIGDPTFVVAHADEFHEELKVIATFINRIALWSVYKKPKKRRNKGPGWWQSVNQLEARIEEHGRLLGNELNTLKTSLGVAFHSEAETNKALIRYFFNCDSSTEKVAGFGLPEYEVLNSERCHISLTSAPWLRKRFESLGGENDFTLALGEWMPPIPFPFSSVITTLTAYEENFRSQDEKAVCQPADVPIATFIKFLLIANTLAYRQRTLVESSLYVSRYEFRQYGLPQDFDKEIEKIISEAVKLIVDRDYLSEDLSNTWVAWDFVNEVEKGENGPLDWAELRGRFDRSVCGTLEIGFWRSILNDEFFWKHEFRGAISKFVEAKAPGIPAPPLYIGL